MFFRVIFDLMPRDFMKIEIYYQKNTDHKPQLAELKAADYFDLLEEHETFEADGIPKFNSAEEYLNLSAEELLWTDIRVQGSTDDHNIRTEYYRGGHSMWHRKNYDGIEEICVITQISASQSHIVRIGKTAGSNWKTIWNTLIEELPDGSEKEVKFV